MKEIRASERAFPRRNAIDSLPAIGLEAEFATIVDGVLQQPEDVFGSPRNVVRGPLIHRTGRSYHLPTGGALYFDTGVMEVATPMIEISRGCGARGTRSLWESIGFLRAELDAWERKTNRTVRLSGFSTHYNVSFETPGTGERSVYAFAYLLTHILYAPVMLLAANRKSTGIGVRPRGNRVEVTADFTPDAALMAATATLIVGVMRSVMSWNDFSLPQLDAHLIPRVRHFSPVPHSSRKGWVAKDSCFTENPFLANVDEPLQMLTDGSRVSLREIAGRITRIFWPGIQAVGDPLSLRLIAAVMRGRAPSLLELDDRPGAYDDVGRLCTFNDLFPITTLSRSRYERVLGNAIGGHRVRFDGAWHKPVGVKGWTHVVFRRERDGARRVRSLDALLMHLDAWDRSANRRSGERREPGQLAPLMDRRIVERRADLSSSEERRRKTDAAGDTLIEGTIPQSHVPIQSRSTAAHASAQSPLVIIARI